MDKENLGGEKAIIEERRKKLEQLRDKGSAYGNSFKPKNNAKSLSDKYGDLSKEDLVEKNIKNISIAGRIVLKRVMGNASFATLRDSSGDIQIYVTKNNVDESVYEDFKTWDLGDIVGVSGSLFRTKTDELTIDVWDLEMITKSLRPMPEKFKGLTDIEARYRQRYLDLMTNVSTKEVFIKRTKIIDSMRKKMNEIEEKALRYLCKLDFYMERDISAAISAIRWGPDFPDGPQATAYKTCVHGKYYK